MNNTAQTGVPVKYIGKKQEKTDNVANTGLTWTRGQIHGVPPVAAQILAKHPTVWQIVSWGDVDADPARLGVIVDSQPPAALVNDDPAAPKVEGEQQPDQIDTPVLPNLQGMTKPDLVSFAEAQFNQKLDGRNSKESLIDQIVALTNSTATGAAQ